jgi:hypothetical protein
MFHFSSLCVAVCDGLQLVERAGAHIKMVCAYMSNSHILTR